MNVVIFHVIISYLDLDTMDIVNVHVIIIIISLLIAKSDNNKQLTSYSI